MSAPATTPTPAPSDRVRDRADRPVVPQIGHDLPALNTLLTLVVCVVVVAALDLAREVLIPITLAVLLSFVLAPLASLLRRLHLGRVPSVLLSVIFALGLITAIGGLIGSQIADLVSEAPRYQQTIEKKLQTAREMTIGRLNGLVTSVGHQFAAAPTPAPKPAQEQSQEPSQPQAQPEPQAGALTSPPASGSPQPTARAPIPVEVHQPDPSPFDLAEQALSKIIGPLSTVAIVFIVAIFILLQREDLRDRLIRLFGSGDLHRTTAAMNDAAKRLSRYFLAQLAINAGFGVVVAIGLLIIGVPSPVLWGIVAGLLRFLPYLGAPLAAVLPMALAAAVEPGWSMVLWTGGLFLLIEALTGQVVEPMLYSHSTGLSPVSVVVAATFWTWLWGPIGLIMSTPLTLCLVVLGRHVKRLEFLEVLLGDRPALTPIESFYQRVLAGDSDEATDQAEVLLRERALSSYYDEVAIPGLRMAADDRLRGVLTEPQMQKVQTAFDAVMRELDDNEDVDPNIKEDPEDVAAPSQAERELPRAPAPKLRAPPPSELGPLWGGDGAILCIAGRGPLDEAAAAMLAQLLAKHGLGARVVQHADVSPQRLTELDLTRAAMACVCYLQTSGTPSHVRYLVRRLRQRRPQLPVVVGLWPAGEEILDDVRHQATLGAQHYVGSLRGAVEVCVAAAISASATGSSEPVAGSPGTVVPVA